MHGKHEQVCPGVWMVGGPGLSDERDGSVYLLDLGEKVLIDCGIGPSWPAIAANIASTGVDPLTLHTLVLTHCHLDHAGAAAALKDRIGCRIVAHAGDVPALESGDAERTAADWYGLLMLPVPVDHVVTGAEETLTFGSDALRIIHTPGHTPGSLVAVLRRDDQTVLFGQDIHGPFCEAFDSDIAAWRASMERLLALQANILCEGHFGVIHGAQRVNDFILDQLSQHPA